MPYTKQEKQRALECLREIMRPGDTVYTILRSVAKSGMSRTLDCYIVQDGKPCRITYSVARILGWTLTDNGLRVSGCGMDAGFHTVYSLSCALHPDGFTCIGDRCPSNDHSNGDRDYSPHPHSDGGYSLRHEWL